MSATQQYRSHFRQKLFALRRDGDMVVGDPRVAISLVATQSKCPA